MAWGMEEADTKKVQDKKEVKLINDVEILKIKFDELKRNSQKGTDNTYNVMLPVIRTLFGDDGDANNEGDINIIQRRLKDSPLIRTTIGKAMVDVSKNIDLLYSWQTAYERELERYYDNALYLCTSALLIIERMKKETEDVKAQASRMRDNAEESENSRIESSFKPPLRPEKKHRSRYIPDQRKQYLMELYDSCNTSFEFIAYVNEKKSNLSFDEIEFLKAYNKVKQKFVRLGRGEPNGPQYQKNLTGPSNPANISQKDFSKNDMNNPDGGLEDETNDGQ